jgi:hypothetical protein
MTTQFREALLLDDFANPPRASNGNRWQYFSDRVMGGISQGSAEVAELRGRQALHLSGDISLANNGGFIQAALDLAVDGPDFDASAYDGIAITARGDGGTYAVNLRSADVSAPWQSYRCEFVAGRDWEIHYLPFGDFRPNRIDLPLDTRRLRRLGIIAIGEAGPADVAVARIALFVGAL